MSGPEPATSPDGGGAYADRLLADAARAADAARVRLSGALNDLFRSPESRLNDRDHATMNRMLVALIREIETDIRVRLSAQGLLADIGPLADELADARIPIAWPRLSRSRVMRDDGLIQLLLRRSDEHHLSTALRAAYPARFNPDAGAMDRLLNHANAAISDAAQAVLLSEQRRFDRFGDPLVGRADLPIELQHRVTWWAAAALRDHMLASHDIEAEDADRALVAATSALMDGYDEGVAIDRLGFALAYAVRQENALDDNLLAGLLREGQVALWVASLAVRALIDSDAVWPMLTDPDASRLTLLLRAIGMDRTVALALLADLFLARGGVPGEQDERLARAAFAFDALSQEEAHAAIRPWRPGDHYRRAVARLALDEGQAT